MGSYLKKKCLIYALTFFIAMSINWMIPRLMPGDPISSILSRFAKDSETFAVMQNYINKTYQLDQPLWKQYFNFWGNVFTGDFGMSIQYAPKSVSTVIMESLPYTLAVLIPALLLSWFIGNWFGAFAARRKNWDNTLLPISYIFMSAPYFWLGIILVWLLGMKLDLFPFSFAYSPGLRPSFSLHFIIDFLWHWVLPFLSLFLVSIGSWAIGMRNLVIYELDTNYSKFLESLGADNALIRNNAYQNAILPQITGLALQLGTLIAGNVLLESVFSYPGVGFRLFQAVKNLDYFLIQGGFSTVIILVLLFNFIIDIIYLFIDPRIRTSFGGSQ